MHGCEEVLRCEFGVTHFGVRVLEWGGVFFEGIAEVGVEELEVDERAGEEAFVGAISSESVI